VTAGERRLLEFLGGRLEAMLHRPDQWGPPLVVEQLVLQLLEMRALVLDPAAAVNQKHRIIRSFVRFMKESVPDATPEPLALQLERQGRGAELANILRKFVDRELIEATGEKLQAAEGLDQQEQPGDPAIERAERLLELFEGKAKARMRRAAPPRVDPVDLGSRKS
jgi:hypothetical protein